MASVARQRAGKPSVTRLIHKRRRQADDHAGHHEGKFRSVASQQVLERLPDIRINAPTFLDRRNDGGEVIVGDNDFRRRHPTAEANQDLS